MPWRRTSSIVSTGARATPIYQTTAYGQSGRQYLADAFQKLGVPVVYEEGVAATAKDLKPVIAKALEAIAIRMREAVARESDENVRNAQAGCLRGLVDCAHAGLAAELSEEQGRLWEASVGRPFRDTCAGRFPFDPAAAAGVTCPAPAAASEAAGETRSSSRPDAQAQAIIDRGMVTPAEVEISVPSTIACDALRCISFFCRRAARSGWGSPRRGGTRAATRAPTMSATCIVSTVLPGHHGHPASWPATSRSRSPWSRGRAAGRAGRSAA